MGYVVFLVCLVLEYCPVEGWDWDFNVMWMLIVFVLVIQIAVDVTKSQGRPKTKE